MESEGIGVDIHSPHGRVRAMDIPESVFRFAVEIFGEAKQAQDWFADSNNTLGDKTPLQVLAEDGGEKKVKETLSKIDLGLGGRK